MFTFLLAVGLTLGVSALCSILEAMVLSTTSIDVEELKKSNPRTGRLIEGVKSDIETTISSILTINTVANTLGAILVGGLAIKLFGEVWLGLVSALMTLAILLFSEILPKNLGVVYRRSLFPILVFALLFIIRIATPLTKISSVFIRLFVRTPAPADRSQQEIMLIAERGAREGTVTAAELHLIHSSLALKSTRISGVMTPRNVVTLLSADDTAGEVLERFGDIPFGRMPVESSTSEDIIGVVRRRDILHCIANSNRDRTIHAIMQTPVFVPEVGTIAKTLESLLETHQQLGVVIDEFGSFSGVITLEDIFEHLIGKEFYEPDDRAADMRVLAASRSRARTEISAENQIEVTSESRAEPDTRGD